MTELLDNSAARWPEKPAFIEGDEITTYHALAARAQVVANALGAHSIKPGSRVGVYFPNSTASVVLTFALWRLRVVVVPLATECADAEIRNIIESLELCATVGSAPRVGAMEVASDCHLELLPTTEAADNHGLDIAFIRFTSGTTAARKGVVLTHGTIRDRIAAANKGLQITDADTVIWCLPMAHHFLVTIVLYIASGATTVLARHVLAEPFLQAIRRWRGTVLYAAPFHYAMLAQHRGDERIDSVRLAVATTCALAPDVAAAFVQRFGRRLSPALGIIEAGLVCLNREPDPHEAHSVGRPLPDFDVRVLAPDADGCGDIALRGPGICDAYVAPWTTRAGFAPDGWFVTGDIGRVDESGRVFLLSRKTAVINLAGRKVFPEEIEAVLNEHPAVIESRAFARAHPHLGEVLEAELVLNTAEDLLGGILAHCRERLAAYKIPARFHIVSQLPRTAVTGKIRRAPAPV